MGIQLLHLSWSSSPLVSIQLISPASGNIKIITCVMLSACFHSINIPSEWECVSYSCYGGKKQNVVSIQLKSPASGNGLMLMISYLTYLLSFHSINIPSEWEYLLLQVKRALFIIVSIQLISPASGN